MHNSRSLYRKSSPRKVLLLFSLIIVPQYSCIAYKYKDEKSKSDRVLSFLYNKDQYEKLLSRKELTPHGMIQSDL